MKNGLENLPPDGSIDAGLILLEIHFKDTPLTQADIAEVCGTTVQNIQGYEYRALRKIREELNRRGIEERFLR